MFACGGRWRWRVGLVAVENWAEVSNVDCCGEQLPVTVGLSADQFTPGE